METRVNDHEVNIGYVLSELRHIMDWRRQNTFDERTVDIIRLTLSHALDDTDELAHLKPYMPAHEQIPDWYRDRVDIINHLRTEDRHNIYTGRYDLEHAIMPYKNSRWLSLSKKIAGQFSMSNEAANADIAIKLMCREAIARYNDVLDELTKNVTSNTIKLKYAL